MQEHAHDVSEVAQGFLPHGFCYLWKPELLWTHVVMDLMIGLAYVAIGTALVYLVWKGRREFPFQGMFAAFGLFILACGATHFVEIYTMWNPAYWFSAGVKGVTALASVGTAVLLPPLIPRVLNTIRQARLSEERRIEVARARILLESEQRFRVLAEAQPQIVWTADPDGAVDYYNGRWFEWTGTSTGEARGWGWRAAIHPDDLARTVAAWRAALESGSNYEISHRIRHFSGEHRWMLSRARPARDASGAVIKWYGSATDIDAQKQVELELRKAKDAAEAASRAREQFVAVMSHELRTPLNAVLGYTEILGTGMWGELNDKQRQGLSRVEHASKHLLRLIDGVLTYARSESAPLSAQAQRVRVRTLVEGAVELVAPLIRQKELDFRVSVADDEATVTTDPGIVSQILVNLLGNAAKFTEEGEVALSAALEEGTLILEVRDTGVGIDPSVMERVWEPFWQADASLTRRNEGTGLGLTITRRLVETLGGTIEAESELGEGARFTVRLPGGRSRPAPDSRADAR
ncbi:MAG TPA: ATP-binding protein [Longimicrobiales bacterium]|nr:ATP-binding protein [Longimicrobiales bacterium]